MVDFLFHGDSYEINHQSQNFENYNFHPPFQEPTNADPEALSRGETVGVPVQETSPSTAK